MSKLVSCALLAPCALLISGCTTFRYLEAQSRVDPHTVALYRAADGSESCAAATASAEWAKMHPNRAPGDFRDGGVNLNCGEANKLYRVAAGDPALPQDTSAALTAEATKAQDLARNRLASMLMKHADDVCTVEMGRLVSREAMANTALSFGTSALSTASSVVTGDLAKSILSGGSSLTNASRENLNAHVYRNVLSTAIAKAIENERGRLRPMITGRFKKPVSTYSVDQMVMDVNEYHQACSFYRGLGLVMDAVSRTSATESDEYIRINGEIMDFDSRIAAKQATLAGLEDTTSKTYLALDAEIAELISMRRALYQQRAAIVTPTKQVPEPESTSDDQGG